VHDLIEALRGGYGIMLAAAALYQGACRSIHSFAYSGLAGRGCAALAPAVLSLVPRRRAHNTIV
jgi:hypothetical protein